MLSIKKLTNASATAHYFEKDNYYKEGSPDAEENSEWLGKGASLEALTGSVSNERFQQVLAGHVGDKRLGRQKSGGEWSHTAGWDLTFSAPKSVSILAELSGDSRYSDAHRSAVRRTVSLLEESCAQVRVDVNRKKTFVQTKNLIAAAFHHNTSRELDPQVHTHVIVANATWNDGRWRSLSSEKLFDFKMFIGKSYRETLIEELKSRNLSIRITDKDQLFFEISGVPDEVIKHFSTRRQMIEQELKRLGMEGGKASSVAALGTRQRKKDIDNKILRSQWEERLRFLGFDPVALTRNKPIELENEVSDDGDVSVTTEKGIPEQRGQDVKIDDMNNEAMPGMVEPKLIDESEKEGEKIQRLKRKKISLDCDFLIAEIKVIPTHMLEERGVIKDDLLTLLESDLDSDELEKLNLKVKRLRDHILAELNGKHGSIQNVSNSTKTIREILDSEITVSATAKRSIRYAVEYLSEREASFKESDVVKVAISSFSGLEKREVIVALNSAVRNGDIVVKSNMTLTTKGAVALEKDNIQRMISGRDRSAWKRSPFSLRNINTDIERSIKRVYKGRDLPPLTDGQLAGIRLIATTSERYTAIQGRAGVGKTTLLGISKEMMEKKNKPIRFMAPTGAAVSVLSEELETKATTIDQFLIDCSNKNNSIDKNETWVIDEAGMISSRQMARIMEAADTANARVVFVGDTDQLESVEAGRPMAQLIDAGMTKVLVGEIKRQKNKELLGAVYDVVDGKIAEALTKVGKNITSISGNEERLNKAVDRYYDLGASETMLIIPANKDRHDVNGLIRQRMKGDGSLKKEVTLPLLENKDMRKIEKTRAENYSKKDVIRLGYANEKLGIERGEYFHVVATDSVKNTISIESLKTKDTKTLKLDFVGSEKSKDGIEVYRAVDYKIAEGERMRWKRTIKDEGLVNGQEFTVKEIQGENITIVDGSGNENTFGKDDVRFKHADYAYADTTYSSQGKTSKNVVLLLESYRRNLVNKKSSYVGLSRASEHAEIITDDVSKLSDMIESRTGVNTTALEISEVATIEEHHKNRLVNKQLGRTRPSRGGMLL